MALTTSSVNHIAPSGPAVMYAAPPAFGLKPLNSVITPAVVIRPILSGRNSVNQRFSSGPAAIPYGLLLAVGTGNSVMTPAVVIRPMLLPNHSVNHRFPSGPRVMADGRLFAVGMWNSVTTPVVVILPMLLLVPSVNHSAPSGPVVIPNGVGAGNSVITPALVIRPILFPSASVNHMAPSGPLVMTAGKLSALGTGNSLPLTRAWAEGAIPSMASRETSSGNASSRMQRIGSFLSGRERWLNIYPPPGAGTRELHLTLNTNGARGRARTGSTRVARPYDLLVRVPWISGICLRIPRPGVRAVT